MRSGKILVMTMILAVIATLMTALFATSAWYALIVVLAIGLCFVLLGLLYTAVHRRGAGKTPKVLVALLAPLAVFLAMGAISWAIGVPQGIKDWATHAGAVSWIAAPLLYVVVYGLALLMPTLGTIAAVYYVVKDNRMDEAWTVTMVCLCLGILSGGLNHMVAASTAQM